MAATPRHVSNKGPFFGIMLIWAIAQASAVIAYESCINRGEQHSPAGEWCCGNFPASRCGECRTAPGDSSRCRSRGTFRTRPLPPHSKWLGWSVYARTQSSLRRLCRLVSATRYGDIRVLPLAQPATAHSRPTRPAQSAFDRSNRCVLLCPTRPSLTRRMPIPRTASRLPDDKPSMAGARRW